MTVIVPCHPKIWCSHPFSKPYIMLDNRVSYIVNCNALFMYLLKESKLMSHTCTDVMQIVAEMIKPSISNFCENYLFFIFFFFFFLLLLVVVSQILWWQNFACQFARCHHVPLMEPCNWHLHSCIVSNK